MISRSLCRPLAQAIARSVVEGGESAATELPDDANRLGSWFASNYSATPVPCIPNSDATTPAASVINSAPRRLFSNTNHWTKFGTATITDDAAAAPDGSSEATTVNASAGNWVIAFKGASLPAGTYTIGVNAKRNTGTDQVFAFTATNTATRSSVKTATSSWQRFSYTFTLGVSTAASSISLCSSDGATAANIQICDLELYQGASDLGPSTRAGHLVLGSNAYDTTPSYSGGALDLSTGGYGLIQLAASNTITNVTAMAVLSKVTTGSGYESFMSKVQNYSHFSAMIAQSGGPYTYMGAGSDFSQLAGMWGLLGQGYHCLTHRNNGTTSELWLDDIKLFSTTASASSYSLRDIYVGALNALYFVSDSKVANIALWKTGLSDDDVRAAVSALRSKATSAGATCGTARIFCAEGDSITARSGSHAYLAGSTASPAVLGRNFAVAGATLANVVSRASSVDAVIPASINGRKFILSLLIGANDIGATSDMTAYAASIAAYTDARRAAGWKVVICTVTPKAVSAGGASDTTFNTRRAALNTILRTWVGTHADAVADFGGDATVGVDAAASNVTYYGDGLHPTAACYAILGPILKAAVDGL